MPPGFSRVSPGFSRVSSTLPKVSTDPKDRWRDLGSFIREQRGTARLSLRKLSELAGISNPYLSQIERGLRRPSAEILQQIAKALRISAESLYVRAGILEERGEGHDLVAAILGDQTLTGDQKQTLVRVYRSFHVSPEPAAEPGPDESIDQVGGVDGGEAGRPG